MKRVLVLGAGMVAGAHVDYLLRQDNITVTVASRTVQRAREIVGKHPRGKACSLDSRDEKALEKAISEQDIVVSLLPFVYHPLVAKYCVKHRKHMVTTSYVKEPMAALDGPAREAGVLLLNEMGVDPGIDHMTAMRVIDEVKRKDGHIVSLVSWCGGLPAPEANDNPLGYKFSWSPRGVLLAGKNPARYLEDGKEVFIPAEELFDHTCVVPVEIEGRLVELEGYPNRDSLPYIERYGIRETKKMFRGTLRNKGWCRTMSAIERLGYLGEEERGGLSSYTYGRFTAELMGAPPEFDSPEKVRTYVRDHLGLGEESIELGALDWLGLFADDPIPITDGAPVDVLTTRMVERMSYRPHERDMLVLRHEFVAEYPSGERESIVSTMVDFGIPGGYTSMSRTVGLPAAIGVRLILEGRIELSGVQIPVHPEIYAPVLEELEYLGLRFSEVWRKQDEGNWVSAEGG